MRREQREFEERLARFLDEARGEHARGWNRERVLAKLRRHGANKVECILVLKETEGLSTIQAKLAVHTSKTWRDTRKSDEKLLEQLERAAMRIAKEDPSKVEVKITPVRNRAYRGGR